MRYLKYFENSIDPQEMEVGDYVITKSKLNINKIGKIIKINRPDHYATFNYEFLVDFGFKKGEIFCIGMEVLGDRTFLWLIPSDILHWSHNREDLELIIAAKKYNL